MKCQHCGYEWEPRKEAPKFCPVCKRPLFNVTSKKVVQSHKPLQPQPFLLCSAPGCTQVALHEVSGHGNLCKNHYIEFLQTTHQPTQEELLDKEA